MTGALRYEWMRIRTIRSSYWMSALAIALTFGITLLMGLSISAADLDDEFDSVDQVTTYIVLAGASGPFIPVMAAPFYAVMGVMAVGHEYRYGTNKATLSAIPDRVAVLAAKLVVLVAWVLASIAITLLLGMAITWLLLDNPQFGSHLVRPLLNYTGYCVGFAVAGMGLAALLRNQTGAIVAALTWPLVVEPIIYGVSVAISETTGGGIGKLTNLLPSSAGRRSMFDPYEAIAGFGNGEVWSIGAAVIVFWLGVILVLAAGATSFVKRDA
jgi:ABC-type transport system involved in multi-copper enzyme maturation permease subunit